MRKLSQNLAPLIKTEIDEYRLSSILLDEEYMDENRNPLMCQYCDSENLKKYHKVDFDTIPENYQKQILEIYPKLDSTIITFWVCENCNSVVALKLYSHRSIQEKKIYYHKYDSFNQIIKDLKTNDFIKENHEPCQCFYCGSINIKMKKSEDRITAICEDCGKVLGYAYNDTWRIVIDD